MRWFKNLKTSNKILSLIVLISFFLICAGMISYLLAEKANKLVVGLYESRLVAVDYLNQSRAYLRRTQSDIYQLIIYKNKANQRAIIYDIANTGANLEKGIKSYEVTNLDPIELKNFKVIVQEFEKYKKVVAKTLDLVLADKSDQAFSFYQSNVFLVNDLTNKFENMAEYNRDLASKEYKQTINAYTRSDYITLGLLFFALIMAIPLSLYISSLISGPLVNLSRKMKLVTQGNLSVEPVIVMSEDEIGELSKDFNIMTQTLRDLIQREKFLREIMVTSISSLDIKGILNNIVIETGKLFKSDKCYFIEYDAKSGDFLPVKDYEVYISSLKIKDISGFSFNNDQLYPFYNLNIIKRQALIVNNVNEIEVSSATREFWDEYGVKSIMSVPIFYRNVPLGLLIIDYVNDYKEFSQDDIDLLSTIANQSSTLIHPAQLFNEIQESRARESTLRTVINEVLISNNFEEAVQSIVDAIGKLFDVDRIVFRLYDSTNRTFSSVFKEYRQNTSIPSAMGEFIYSRGFDQYIARRIYENKDIYLISDITDESIPEDIRQYYRKLGIKSNLIAPVRYKDIELGVLSLSNIKAHKIWSSDDIEFLQTVLNQASIGMHLFILNDKLSKSLKNEEILGNIITEARKLDDHNHVVDYILDKILKIFNVDRCAHLHLDKTESIIVEKETVRSKEMKSLIGEAIFPAKYINGLFPTGISQVFVINDIDKDISNLEYREYLKKRNIMSFLLYPTAQNEKDVENISGMTFISSTHPRRWEADEIEFYRLIIDAISVIILETQQRVEVEEVRKTFLATLTHDLRSPIYAEQKALEYILSRECDTNLGDFSEYLEDIYKTNEELLRIVNNILTVYHYESGRFELNLESVDVSEMIFTSVRSMKHLAKNEGSEITVSIEENLPSVIADKDQILRVITNLISNAIKHNTKGTNIYVEARLFEDSIEVLIQDNGKGIPESDKSMIFQRYPTSKRQIGTGLGLYLSKQIIEAHNGKIWFESTEGKGTSFYFTIPVIFDKSK